MRSLFVAAPTIRTGSVGTYENKARFKLGPFITTSEFFRRRHILLRVKDKEGSERHGTTGVALKGCVGSDKAQSFEERLTHRTYYRGQVSGEVLVRVAGGQEEGDNTLDEDSVVSTVSHTHSPVALCSCCVAARVLRVSSISDVGSQFVRCLHPHSPHRTASEQDYEQMKSKGEIDDENNSDDEDAMLLEEDDAAPADMEPEPEPEPEDSED